MNAPCHFKALDPSEAATAQALHGLLQAAYRQEAELLGVSDFPPLRRSVQDLQGSGECWIGAWVDGELVGAISLYPDEDDDVVTCIGALVTHPTHQRQGVATRLLHAARVSAGMDQPLSVQTALANEPALALYRQAGFRELRRWSVRLGTEKLGLIKLLRRPDQP